MTTINHKDATATIKAAEERPPQQIARAKLLRLYNAIVAVQADDTAQGALTMNGRISLNSLGERVDRAAEALEAEVPSDDA
jgi:hypothetical protein